MLDEEIVVLILVSIINFCYMILLEEDSEETHEDEDLPNLIQISRKRSFYKPDRIENYVEKVVWNYTRGQFQQNFRITLDAYDTLLGYIGPILIRQTDVGRSRLDVEKQILAVIWLLATPDSYRSVGERFDMAKSSLSKCFTRVVNALCDIAPQVIKWPRGNDLERVKEGFERIARIPNIIGAVDGTFIVIKAPKEDPNSYLTRKCNYAMTLQAVCDNRLKFTDCFVGFPGSVSDTRIFRNSDLYFAVLNNHDHYIPNEEFIIGDKAYPVLTWCIPPFIDRGNLTAAQRYFNTKVSQTRQTIERAFALLFGRFRRLKFLDMNKTSFIPNTVLACTILHNICLNFEDLLIEEYVRGGLNAVQNNGEDIDVFYNEQVQEGRNKRQQICRTLYQYQ